MQLWDLQYTNLLLPNTARNSAAQHKLTVLRRMLREGLPGSYESYAHPTTSSKPV